MSTEQKNVISGEASETDEENDCLSSENLKESIEKALNDTNMIQSLVIQGEASESEDDAPAQAMLNLVEPKLNASMTKNSNIPTETGLLMRDLQEDVANTLKLIVHETQEKALNELSACNQLLLSSQVVLQNDSHALKKAESNLQMISQKFDDIFSFNFIPHIQFFRSNQDLIDDLIEEPEQGIDMLANDLFNEREEK